MTDASASADPARARANEPDDLARLLLERMNAADVEGVVELYEPDAVLALPDGGIAEGHEQLRRFYAELLAPQPSFAPGQQLPALRLGDLALTATRLASGGATLQVPMRVRRGRISPRHAEAPGDSKVPAPLRDTPPDPLAQLGQVCGREHGQDRELLAPEPAEVAAGVARSGARRRVDVVDGRRSTPA